MSYSTVSDMQQSASLMDRCTAAVAVEITAGNTQGNDASVSKGWVDQRSWDLAATPGWAAQWESGVASGITDPGASAGVITDGNILSRVQQLLIEFPL